jgi:outer membrane protein assembly factor BamA
MPVFNNYLPKIIKRFKSGAGNRGILVQSWFFILAILLALSSCHPAKRVPKGRYLLVKNNVSLTKEKDKDSRKAINEIFNKETFGEIIKQQPNHKILGVFRLHLGIYNDIDTLKLIRDIKAKEEKLAAKNEKREAKGKNLKKYKKPWRQWMAEDVGEPPVVYDSALTNRSMAEFNYFLYNKGFFNPKISYVTDPETSYPTERDSSKKKIKVYYKIDPGKSHRLNKIEFNIPNIDISRIVNQDIALNDSVLRVGDRLDLDKLETYQTHLSRLFKSHGYYLFNRSLIYFEVDTGYYNQTASLVMKINKDHLPVDAIDSIKIDVFQKFYVKNITVNTNYPPLKNSDEEPLAYDTITYNGINILYQHKVNFKPKSVKRGVLFSKDSLYNLSESNLTYRRLYSLGVFDIVSVNYESNNSVDVKDGNLPLDAVINLKPTKDQNVSLEGIATNNGGNLGIKGGVNYIHRNIFKSAEHLVLSVSGGLEAQNSLGQSEDQPLGLNTIEVVTGIEIIFQKFLLPNSYKKYALIENPKTFFKIDFSYQQSPDYNGTILSGYFGYRWNSGKMLTHRLNVVQVSQVNIDKSPEFDEYLKSLNNAVVEAIYDDRFIPSTKYFLTLNNQLKPGQKRAVLTYFTFQQAGNVSYLLGNAFNAPTNDQGQFEIGGTAFAQFLKGEIDFRHYNYINQKNTVAYRIDLGTAVPYGNLNVIPFNDAFFVGGSNSNRGWRARTLGPGSFFDSTGVETYDKVADIKIDLSLEYRFNLIGVFDLALFVDAGNIWFLPQGDVLTKDNPVVFNVNRFYNEIAFSVGAGIRLNFNFFLLRFDFGLQTKDPSIDRGERWLFQSKDNYNQKIDGVNQFKRDNPELYPNPVFLDHYRTTVIFNLAIGYPF